MRLLFALVSVVATFAACDEHDDSACKADADCPALVDGGASDGAVPVQDASTTPADPFDSGAVAPTCKGIFELCTGQECCSPSTCVSGTCR